MRSRCHQFFSCLVPGNHVPQPPRGYALLEGVQFDAKSPVVALSRPKTKWEIRDKAIDPTRNALVLLEKRIPEARVTAANRTLSKWRIRFIVCALALCSALYPTAKKAHELDDEKDIMKDKYFAKVGPEGQTCSAPLSCPGDNEVLSRGSGERILSLLSLGDSKDNFTIECESLVSSWCDFRSNGGCWALFGIILLAVLAALGSAIFVRVDESGCLGNDNCRINNCKVNSAPTVKSLSAEDAKQLTRYSEEAKINISKKSCCNLSTDYFSLDDVYTLFKTRNDKLGTAEYVANLPSLRRQAFLDGELKRNEETSIHRFLHNDGRRKNKRNGDLTDFIFKFVDEPALVAKRAENVQVNIPTLAGNPG